VIHAWAPWVWGTTKSAVYTYIYLYLRRQLFMPLQARVAAYSLCSQSVHSFVRPFVCYESYEHDIFKMNEPIWFWCQLAIVVHGAKAEMINCGVRRSKQSSRSHGAEIGHKISFWQDVSRTVQWMLTKPSRHNNSDVEVKGQGHVRPDRFGGLAETSFLTPLGWVAFLIRENFVLGLSP